MAKKTEKKIICVVDTETTGRKEDGGEIIELGAVKYVYKNGKAKIIDRFFQRIKPKTDYFAPRARKVNRIDPDSLKDKPGLKEVLSDFLLFIRGSILVFHRAGFDVTFLKEAISDYGFPMPGNWVCDTAEMGKLIFKKKALCLEDMMKILKIKRPFGRHKSWVDCICTAEVFFKMARGYRLKELSAQRFQDVIYRRKK